MIIVSDNEGDRVEVGTTRLDLENFLEECCSDDYAAEVLTWFDAGAIDTLVLPNGAEGITDTWVTDDSEEEDDDMEDYDDFDLADEVDDAEQLDEVSVS